MEFYKVCEFSLNGTHLLKRMFEQLGRRMGPTGPSVPRALKQRLSPAVGLNPRPPVGGGLFAACCVGLALNFSSSVSVATKLSDVTVPPPSVHGLWRHRPLPGPCSLHLFIPSFIHSTMLSVSEVGVLGSVFCLERDPQEVSCN